MATLNVKNFPDSVYKKLQSRAKSQRRSVAQEVILMIENDLKEKKKHAILELQGLGKEIWKDTDVERYLQTERDT